MGSNEDNLSSLLICVSRVTAYKRRNGDQRRPISLKARERTFYFYSLYVNMWCWEFGTRTVNINSLATLNGPPPSLIQRIL